MHITQQSWNKMTSMEAEYVLKLSTALNKSWTKDTAYPGDQPKWSKENVTVGQCAVTSLLVQERLNGEIHRNQKYYHYWNELPSGAFVDFTRDQFKTNETIESEGVVEAKQLLQGERAENAKTKERLRRLKKSVKLNLREVKPTIFLLSSNAQREYIQDIIEAIGLPEGSAHHFRYMIKYLHPALRQVLPLQGKPMPKFLTDAQIVVVYLNQTRNSTRNYSWNSILPVRMGTLKQCYKTAAGDDSTAHFYFQMDQAIVPTDAFRKHFEGILADLDCSDYALLTFADVGLGMRRGSPTRLFEEQCQKFRAAEFTYRDIEKGTVTDYDPPLMILIEGIFRKNLVRKDTKLTPKYDNSTNKSYFRLTEATPYYIRFRTLCWQPNSPRQVKIAFAKEAFSTPSEYIQNIRSLYYSECFDLEPAYVEHGTRGSFQIATTTLKKNELADDTSLDSELNIEYQTRRRISLRVLDSLIDFLAASGPTYLAGTKILEYPNGKPWYIAEWPIIIVTIYGLWFLLKLARNVIRGK